MFSYLWPAAIAMSELDCNQMDIESAKILRGKNHVSSTSQMAIPNEIRQFWALRSKNSGIFPFQKWRFCINDMVRYWQIVRIALLHENTGIIRNGDCRSGVLKRWQIITSWKWWRQTVNCLIPMSLILNRCPFGAIGSEKYYVCNPTIIDMPVILNSFLIKLSNFTR